MSGNRILGYDEPLNTAISQSGVPIHHLSPREQEICKVWTEECTEGGTWGAGTRAARRLSITQAYVSQVVRKWNRAPEVAKEQKRPPQAIQYGPHTAYRRIPSKTLIEAYLRRVQEVGFHGALTAIAAEFDIAPQLLQHHIRDIWRPRLQPMRPSQWPEHGQQWWRVWLPAPHGEARVYRHISQFTKGPSDWAIRWPDGRVSYYNTRGGARAAIAEKYMPKSYRAAFPDARAEQPKKAKGRPKKEEPAPYVMPDRTKEGNWYRGTRTANPTAEDLL